MSWNKVKEYPRQLTKASVRELSRRIFDGLVTATPVASGEARAGWTMGRNRPGTYKPPRGQRSYARPKGSTVNRAMRGFRLGDQMFVNDNVSHMAAIAGGRRRVQIKAHSRLLRGRLARVKPHTRAIGSLKAPRPFVGLVTKKKVDSMRNWKFRGGS